MNIFNKVTLQSMKKSRTRTLVTIIGVVLSAAMITAVATFVISLQAYLVEGSVQKNGSWHVQFLDVDSAFVQERLSDPEAASLAALQNIGYAALEGGQNPDKPYLFIAGFSGETFDALPLTLTSGRLPENSGEVLIPSHVAANGGVTYRLGDTLSFAVGSRISENASLGQHTPYAPGQETLVAEVQKQYTVVGFYQRASFEAFTAPGYTLITVADQIDSAHSFNLFVTLENPRRVHAYASEVRGEFSTVFNNNVLRFLGLSDDSWFNALLYSFGGILVALIMIGSILLIYNSFAISLGERTRQFGILASVGATPKQLRNSVLFEGLCIGAVGIPIGLLAGIGSIALAIWLVTGVFSSMNAYAVTLSLSLSVPALAAAAAVSLVTILISAYIPARKAAKTPIMESIRQTGAVKIRAGDVKTSERAARIFGLSGMLALKNFKRNKRRYRSIVLSLALSVVLFISSSAFGLYVKQAAEQSVVDADYDICFSTREMDENQVLRLYERFKTADGITESTYQTLFTYSCPVHTSDLTSVFWESYQQSAGLEASSETAELKLDIQFIEDGIYEAFLESLGLPIEAYTGQDAAMIIVGKQPGQIDLFKDRSMDFTLSSGSGTETKTIRTTFVETYPLDPPPAGLSEVKGYVFMAVAPYQMKPQFDALDAPAKQCLFFWSKTPSESVAQMEAMIAETGTASAYDLYNVHLIMEQSRSILFVTNVFTYGFVIMISLIAIANVFNTISTNIRLRRRELAMLRSVGMTGRDFNRMMIFECAFYGMKALLFGLPAAGILCLLIYKVLAMAEEGIAFTLPWASIGISVCSVFLIVFITMLYATRKIKRENIIDALRDDMT